jgi:HD-GYP domain-containing protein (c-di-GMP phosphodiesterase class II)
MKNILRNKIITPVPSEMKEQFDDMQLKNSIFRLRLLGLLGFLSIIVNSLSYLGFRETLQFENLSHEIASLLNIRGVIILVNTILFFIFSFAFKGKNNKILLWTICLVFITGYYAIYSYNYNFISIASNVTATVFITLFLFTIMPDFNPKISILYASFYLIAIVLILTNKYKSGDGCFRSFEEYVGIIANCINITFFIVITKILLYNGKVKNYVNTHKINSLNDELRKYNDNLEEMVNRKTATIVELKNAVMETMADLVERRDDTTGGHISRTSNYLKIMIDTMLKRGLYREQTASWNIDQMVLSAQLHDVGKISIDDSILRKPAKLDENEFEQMKKHTILGGEIIKEIQEKTVESDFLNYAYIFAVYHHEKWDGSGYPYGITAENIPLPARIMAIIDVYDALISERPYKKPFSHEEAIKIIANGKGSHFDPYLAEIFISISEQLNIKK